MYKKFQNLANSGSDGGSCSGEVVSNPPDIITENVPRRGELRSKIEDSEEEVEQDNDDEDSIVLPEHLQNMVDQAMKDLLDQSQ